MRILLTVEDESYGEAIVDFAANQNLSADSELKIVHFVEPLLIGSYMSVCPSQILDEIRERKTTHATKMVELLKTRLEKALSSQKVSVSADVITELPKDGIIALAQDWKADMIVMGSHGRRGLHRIFLGSVAAAVVSHANCTVTIIRLPALDKIV